VKTAGLSGRGTEEAKLKAPGGAGVGGTTCLAGEREGGVEERLGEAGAEVSAVERDERALRRAGGVEESGREGDAMVF